MEQAMLPKVVIVLTCLCAVKAAVITINAYDENNNEISQDLEDALVRTGRSCGAEECNRFCKKMGYARGVCIGTYCQCRALSTYDDLKPELESQSADDVRSAFLNAIQPEIEVGFGNADTLDESVRSCVNSQCNSLCRRLGFARGVCSPTVCRCIGRLRATEDDAVLDDVNPEEENVLGDDETLDRSVSRCVNSQCNSLCRRLGFARGVCVSPTVCRCSGRLRATEDDAVLNNVNPEVENVLDDDETLDRSVSRCVNSQCNSLCRRLGFARGVCVSPTVCRCSGRLRATEDDAAHDNVNPEVENVLDDDETLDRSVSRCVNSQCNSLCRRLGFARGVCVSPTVCRCSGRLRATEDDAALDNVNPEVENVLEDDETLDRSVRSCVNSQCNSLCRLLGFARGVCVSPTVCRCSATKRYE